MNATPRASSLCDLPTFRTWCRQLAPSQQTVQAAPAPSTTTATVSTSGFGLKEGRAIAIALLNPTTPANAGTYLRNLLTNVDGALTWDAALPEAPKTGDTVADADFDADAVVIIDGVSDWMERETGYIWLERTITETFSGDNRPKHPFRFRPVTELTTVQYDETATIDVDDTSLYFLEADYGMITLKGGQVFAAGIGNCSLVYKSGLKDYTSPTTGQTKADLYLATGLDLMKVIFDRVQNGTLTVSSMNAGPFGTSIKAGLPDTLKMQLERLKDTRGLV
jgi:hypothetical protein